MQCICHTPYSACKGPYAFQPLLLVVVVSLCAPSAAGAAVIILHVNADSSLSSLQGSMHKACSSLTLNIRPRLWFTWCSDPVLMPGIHVALSLTFSLALILAVSLTLTLPFATSPCAQRACISLLYEAALLCDDDTRLQRAVPFLISQISDSSTLVR